MKEMTLEEARVLIRKIMGPETRLLEGEEKEYMLTIFGLLEPIGTSDNQRTWTEVYKHAGKTYHVHYWNKDDIDIEEIIFNEES